METGLGVVNGEHFNLLRLVKLVFVDPHNGFYGDVGVLL